MNVICRTCGHPQPAPSVTVEQLADAINASSSTAGGPPPQVTRLLAERVHAWLARELGWDAS